VNGALSPGSLIARVEPSLNRAVDFALGEGLLRRPSGDKIELTHTGIELADEIYARGDTLAVEKHFMNELNSLAEIRDAPGHAAPVRAYV